MLTIYNTLTQKKEVFKPIEAGKVGMYVCGMTVYDYCHMGHARTMVAFDAIVRYLRARHYDVNYICNITDIDDKIINRANENHETCEALTQRFIQAMKEDMAALFVLPPNDQPCATHHIDGMVEMIKGLLDKGFAYVGDNADVYFDVRRFSDYGKLSHRNLDQMQSGSRVEVSEAKKNPLDFVLWKAAKLGEPAWASPWGAGRPGWHIECSVMSLKALGKHFDIHGGGFDLIFPHHENEIAQSEANNEEAFANYWMHVGFLQINKEKMSKSLNNFFTIREVLKEHHPEVLRYFILTSHYRSPLNYSEEGLVNAKQALERIYLALRGIHPAESSECLAWRKAFFEAMDDDFNTPQALAVLFELTRELNRVKESSEKMAAHLAYELIYLAKILGIINYSSEDFLRAAAKSSISSEEIETLIAERQAARNEKNWKKADEVRAKLIEHGVLIEDTKEGKTSWRYI